MMMYSKNIAIELHHEHRLQMELKMKRIVLLRADKDMKIDDQFLQLRENTINIFISFQQERGVVLVMF